MSGLSNFFKAGNAAGPPAAVIRPVGPGEIATALSLLLGTPERLGDPQQVGDFEELARVRDIDLTTMTVAELGGRLAAAALPVPSPGRTVLLLLSPAGRSTLAAGLAARCAARAFETLPGPAKPLVQVLLEPAEARAGEALVTVGFEPLATLAYLQRRLKRPKSVEAVEAVDDDLPFVHYAPETHARFARAIEASYVDSLDCPAMRGLRSIDDVIAGHRATGDFDPALWFCFTDGETGGELGVLLLSPVTQQSMMELVYLGLVPAARGRRLADGFMRIALHEAATRGNELLTLAVDTRNVPALRLYHRAGMAEIARREALIRRSPVRASTLTV